ncbi:MAG: hypothetical protein ACYSWO_30540 [Planctomycetota bacterium]|jgi:hypothetical protein
MFGGGGFGLQKGGPVEGYQGGGDVVANQPGRSDFGDYMSNLLYGQTFNREVPQAPQAPMRVPIQQIQRSQGSQPNLQMQTMPSGAYGGGKPLPFNPIVNAQNAADSYKMAQSLMKPYGGAGFGQDIQSIADMINVIGGPRAAQQGMFKAADVLASLNQSTGTILGNAARAGAFHNQEGKQEGGKIDGMQKGGRTALKQTSNPDTAAGIMAERNPALAIDKFKFDLLGLLGIPGGLGGAAGKIQGPAVPPDTVPILAQGGEGVIPVHLPVHLMHELENTSSGDPLLNKLKELMGFGMVTPGVGKASSKLVDKKGCGGKVGMQKGGKLPKSERKLGMKGTAQKMQGGGRPGPFEMFQDPSLYEQYYGALPESPELATAALMDAIMRNRQEEQPAQPSVSMTKGGSGGKGNASIMESSVTYGGVPLTGPLSEEQKRSKRIDDAMRRMSLIQSAMVLDPQGGGIQQTGPQDIAQQQEIIKQQQEAQAAYEQAEAQKAYGEAIAGQRAPVQIDPTEQRTQDVLTRTASLIGKENPSTGGPYTAEEVAIIQRDQLQAEGLPVPMGIEQAAAQAEAQAGAGVTGQITGQTPGAEGPPPEQVFRQWFQQGGDYENMPMEMKQAFIEWAKQQMMEGNLSKDQVKELLGLQQPISATSRR